MGLEPYAPVARELPPVSDWRTYRVGGLLDSDVAPPHRYVVILDVEDIEQLARAGHGRRGASARLLAELHGFAGLTQLMSERFV